MENKCLAVKLWIQALRIHIQGRKFTVMTDNRPLEWMNKMKAVNSRLTKWSLNLQHYRFSVKYRSGKMYGNVDALLRLNRENSMTTSLHERRKVM